MTVAQPVLVRYFAAAADAAGREEERIALPATATLGLLRRALIELHGEAMERVLENGSFLVDGIAARDDAQPIAGDVDVLPPFTGG